MGLAEAARFATLCEAEVACSALNACGVSAVVFDRNYAGNVWMNQVALSGIRVMAPAEKLADARLILREARTSDRAVLKWGRDPAAISGIPLALLTAYLGYGGLAIVLLKQRFTFLRLAVAVLYAAPIVLLTVVVVLLRDS